MSRLLATVALDVRLQGRNRLYVIGIVVAVMTGLLARYFLEISTVATLLPGLWIGAIGSTTFMFVAGMLLLEKDQRTLDAIIVTPLRVPTYLLSKVATLSGFAVVESILVLLLAHGLTGVDFVALLLGLASLGVMYTLAAIGLAVTRTTVPDFLVPAGIVGLTVLELPFVHAFELWTHPVLYVLPTQAPVVLMKGGFAPLAPWQWAYGLGYGLVAIAGFAWWAHRRFIQHIVQKGAGA